MQEKKTPNPDEKTRRISSGQPQLSEDERQRRRDDAFESAGFAPVDVELPPPEKLEPTPHRRLDAERNPPPKREPTLPPSDHRHAESAGFEPVDVSKDEE